MGAWEAQRNSAGRQFPSRPSEYITIHVGVKASGATARTPPRAQGPRYSCALTGTLDCANKKLVNGWIQCTYCVGDITEAGNSCVPGLLGPDGGIGGHFAGPVTGDYNTGSHTFVNGTWNGAEAIADLAMMPSEDSSADYLDALALDGGYGFLGKYGGAGAWTAAYGK